MLRGAGGDEARVGGIFALKGEAQTKQAEANLADLRVKLQSQTFDQQAAVAAAQGDLKQDEVNKDREEQMYKAQLDAEVNLRLAEAKWEQASSRFQMEKQKLDIFKESVLAQIESQKVQVEKLRATYLLKKRQLDELTIRAGISSLAHALDACLSGGRRSGRPVGLADDACAQVMRALVGTGPGAADDIALLMAYRRPLG